VKILNSPVACALALLISFGAHAQTATESAPTTPPSAKTSPSSSSDQVNHASLASEDEKFLENAIQGSNAEIKGSQLALEKSESGDVKAFAQMMIDDHQKMAKEAAALATSKGMTPPTEPSAMQTTEITALKALSGGAFDTMYVNRIAVAAHESTVDLFKKATQEVQDPEVKALAMKTLPKLKEHLEMAETLNQKQDSK